MQNLYWLLAANVAIWLGLAAYIAFLASTRTALEKRLRHMEMNQNDE